VNIFNQIRFLFKSKPLRNFDYMRSELEIDYNGEQFWTTSFDGTKLDCMLIPGISNDRSVLGNSIFES
jgi:hypothetical protein